MKKILCLILAVLLVCCTTACDGTNNSDDANATANNHEQTNPLEIEKDNDKETQGKQQGGVVIGDITETVVRNYKTAPASDFEYYKVPGGVAIESYLGNDTIVVIPDSIDGQPVVQLDGYTFANDSSVRGVYVPNTVMELGETFINNREIEVVICEGIEVIGTGTFTSCAALHTVILGENLRELGDAAFSNCKSLEKLYIAPSLTEVDEDIAPGIFYWSDKLTITGEAGSYIESFCADYGIPFEKK